MNFQKSLFLIFIANSYSLYDAICSVTVILKEFVLAIADIKSSKYSVIFIVYECSRCTKSVFESSSQEEIKSAFSPLNLPTENVFILPPFPFPSFDYGRIFSQAVDKTDALRNDSDFIKKLSSNLLLSSLKQDTTTLCSPIVFLNGKYESDGFLYRIGEKRLSRFISEQQICDIASVMHLEGLKDLYFLNDIEQERHLRRN